MKHKKLKLTIIFTLILAVLFLTSYGFFYVTTNQSDRNRLAGGCFNPTFTDGDSISITNAFPMTNKEGLETDPYHFTLTNSCTTKVKYYVILNVKNNSFDEKYINVSLNGGEGQRLDTMPNNTLSGTIDSGYTNSYLLKTGMLEQGSVTENIRAWLNDSTTYEQISQESNSGFTARIKVIGQVGSEYNLATTKIMDLVNGEPTNTTDVITKTAPSGATCTNTLAYDGTSDNNLRYVGADPCNYVTFNNETWRIIGVMNNIDDGTGNLETRIKLIRNKIMTGAKWDNKEANNGWGINDWTKSTIMTNSNSISLNNNDVVNYSPYDEEYKYYNNKINMDSQKRIGDSVWNLGGIPQSGAIASQAYTLERGTNTWGSTSGQACNDGACPRATKWTGKVALMYPSDYGFAVGGTVRNTCLSKNLSSYDTNNCYLNDWLVNKNINASTITTTSDNYRYYFHINMRGYCSRGDLNLSHGVTFTVYLNSNVTITGGSGSQTNPYILS